jgi:hypothetical protein
VANEKYDVAPLDSLFAKIGHDYRVGYTDDDLWDFKVIKEYAKAGDHVLVIGGGNGISTVIAAEVVGDEGRVTVYEGAEEYVNIIKQTLKENGSTGVSVHHAIVGEAKFLYSESGNASIVEPSELPKADVVQMNCEGAESDILPNLSIRPNILHVQVHECYGSDLMAIKSRLEDMNYVILHEEYLRDRNDIIDIIAKFEEKH